MTSLKSSGRLRVNEIFFSLQGEADSVGWPTVFVRLTGCPLRCQYCDTEYAFHEGEWQSIDGVLESVAAHAPRFVCVTGGEPLAQKNCLILLTRLCNAGYRVSLETSGAIDISSVDTRVVRVLDIKTPGSGESKRNLLSNLDDLRPTDVVKFVVCDRADYDWSLSFVTEHALAHRCQIFFSPSHAQVPARDLADWILADHAPVRLQVQLHKYLWGDVRAK